jgi:hypothetical protein
LIERADRRVVWRLLRVVWADVIEVDAGAEEEELEEAGNCRSTRQTEFTTEKQYKTKTAPRHTSLTTAAELHIE